MPSNTTPATATVISSLPYTVTQDPTGGATSSYVPSCNAPAVEIPLWYVYTPPADVTALGLQVSTLSAGYSPVLSVWIGTIPTLTQVTGFCFDFNDPMQQQINVTPGTAYYFQISGSTTTPLTDVVFDVLEGTNLSVAAGDLFVSNDTPNFPAVVLAASGGAIRKVVGFPAFECADTDGPSGVMCVQAEAETTLLIESVNLYDGELTLTHSTVAPVIANQASVSPVSGDQNGTFYLAQVVSEFPLVTPATVSTISTAGVIGATTWTLPADSAGMCAMGVSRDGSTLYYGQPTQGSTAIHAYDLINDAPLSDLVASAGGSTRLGRDIKVMADDSILVVRRSGSANDWSVVQYDNAGATLQTFTFAPSVGSAPRIALGPDDPTTFWVMSFPDGDTSRFTRFTVATGAVLTSFDVAQKDAGDDSAPMFGPSQSCPLLLIQAASTPTPETATTETYRIRCVRRSPHVSDTGQRIFHQRLQCDFQPGIGNTNAPGEDPIVAMRYSNDGGFTWSSARTAPVGAKGQYRTRCQWWRLGQARDRVYEVVWSEPCRGWNLVQAWIELEEGTN